MEFVKVIDKPEIVELKMAKFSIGDVVMHRLFPFRGVIFDVDPVFANSQEWWDAIPAEIRPHKDQPFYHLLAENEEIEYFAYVSEQNLLPDEVKAPIRHPEVSDYFDSYDQTRNFYAQKKVMAN